ncbi:AAA family ATPase [Deinococcus sedimenti]|uniref:ATP-binding protein n=1 Tax=Deinococcus sedimenti TaxID=1867090 RepID=A0ABQ2S5K5_9DEIO|nr:AAA family ATPase [Deinococcus sedimenti]GGR97232.1 ATP-binding protein [Deinococcus sedimenti]
MTRQNYKRKRRSDTTSQVKSFSVVKLNGNLNVNCLFRDNKLVLVGENGYGKTTILVMLYYTMTRQWVKLRKYDFESIELVFGNKNLKFSKSELEVNLVDMPYKNEIAKYIEENALEDIIEESPISFIRDASQIMGIPSIYFRRYVDMISNIELSDNVGEIDKYIMENMNFQVLYLPTYRRIEQDIRKIFPDVARRFNESLDKRSDNSKNYIEFVEFGMNDVDKLLSEELNRLREVFRGSLVGLTNRFLAGILSRNYATNSDIEVNPELYDMLKSRYSKELEITLGVPGFEKTIEDISKKRSKTDHDKIVQYFWQQLLNVYFEQYIASSSMLNFTNIVDGYLVNKDAIFNSQDYSFSIVRNAKKDKSKKENKNNPYLLFPDDINQDNKLKIKLKSLSSGEKQIISLFAHLHFGKFEKAFVIIDEPELSLSIDWQRSFLSDIVSIPNVIGLFSVTHSPFIFDNELEKYTHDLSEFSVMSNE